MTVANTFPRSSKRLKAATNLRFVRQLQQKSMLKIIVRKSKTKVISESQISPLLHAYAPQAPGVVSRSAPFPPYVHLSLNRSIAVPSSGDVLISTLVIGAPLLNEPIAAPSSGDVTSYVLGGRY